jgi:hypothetical protein
MKSRTLLNALSEYVKRNYQNTRWILVNDCSFATSDFRYRGGGNNRPVKYIDTYRPGWVFLKLTDGQRQGR